MKDLDMTRPLFLLICDESGAKGYSDKAEKGLESLGLAVGLILLESQVRVLEAAVNNLREKYISSDNLKFHLADIPADRQEPLRKDVFNIVKSINARLVYNSIQKEGMNRWHEKQKKLNDDTVERNKACGYGVQSRNSKENMLVRLYEGVISRFFAAIIDHFVPDGSFDAQIIFDNNDDNILKSVENGISELIGFQYSVETELKATRFNYKSGSLEKASGISKSMFDVPENLRADGLNNITCTYEINETLAIIPDVVANSLLYYAKINLQKQPELSMNTADLISGHPLADYFVSMSGPDSYDFFGAIYSTVEL